MRQASLIFPAVRDIRFDQVVFFRFIDGHLPEIMQPGQSNGRGPFGGAALGRGAAAGLLGHRRPGYLDADLAGQVLGEKVGS